MVKIYYSTVILLIFRSSSRPERKRIIVKKPITTFSYFNPKPNTKQERTETFLLSKDGLKILALVYKEKLRRKQG